MIHAQATTTRRGISLLEVVISIFVSSVGILGIAALIPAGQIQLQRANISDHGSALGRKALREARLRGLLDPSTWYQVGGAPAITPEDPTNPAVGAYPQVRGARVRGYYESPGFVLDPYGLTRGMAVPQFPMVGSGDVPRLDRLAPFNPASGIPAINRGVADAICLLPDDLSTAPITDLNESANRNAEPVQIFEGDGLRSRQGAYSWMVTLVRETNLGALAGGAFDAADPRSWYSNPHRYIVSAAVSFNRVPVADDKGLPEATIALASDETGTGLMGPTGGFLTLQYSPGSPEAGVAAKLRAGHWIMLGRWNVLPSQPNDLSVRRLLYWARWYRIGAIDDEEDSAARGMRELQVVGPDWPPPFPTTGGNSGGDFAYLVPGVTGVYEETLDLPSVVPYTATVP